MKKKIHKILGVGLALIFAFTLTFAFSAPAMADEEEWDTFDTPDIGAVGDWFMDTTIVALGPIARAIDGTLYMYMDNAAVGPNIIDDLYTSEDDGLTWEATGYKADLFTGGAVATNPITAIACSPEDADVLYVSDATNVYKSDEAGDTDSWSDLGLVTDAVTGDTATAITCLDVGFADDDIHIFVGDAGTPGEVYYYRDAPFASTWTDLDVCAPDSGLAINQVDVYGIACSPDFENDVLAVAVILDPAANTYVAANEGAGIGVTGWNDLEVFDDAAAALIITEATDPVFVEDFDIDDDYEFFVGVSGPAHVVGGLGGVYRITGTTNADDFLLDDVDDDIVSLDLVGDLGSASLVAGAASLAPAAGLTQGTVWYSTDDGDSWDEEDKGPATNAPAGRTISVLVAVDDDFADSGVAWCASTVTVGGKEVGFHSTSDFGATWNGISMLDTDMGTAGAGSVYDVAFAPGYGEDDAPLFLVAESSIAAVDDSVWTYDGDNWERVWYDAANALDLVEVSPYYADDTALFIADSGTPTVLYSHDGGAEFDAMIRNPIGAITAWVVIDDETIISGDAAGDYYKTTRYGRRIWDTDAISAGNDITDFALSPNFASDGTMLCGDDISQVFISTDEGEEWDEVSGNDLDTLATGTGPVYVCFDPDYTGSDGDFFYAASNDAVGRCEYDSAEDWDDQDIDNMNIDDFLAGFAAASGLLISDDGTLYAADATPVVLGAVAAVGAVAGDAFSITETNAAGSGGFIVLGSGTATVTSIGTATFTVATGAWTTAAVGDAIQVDATTAGTFGTWSSTTATCFAAVVSDADGDANVWAGGAIGAGAYALPDAAVGAVAAGVAAGGVARCLNPTDVSADIEWEMPQAGLVGAEAFTGITAAGFSSSLEMTYGSDNVLWVIDTAFAPDAIWEYTDTLAAPVILTSPADGATGASTDEVTFEWDALNADTVDNYRLKLNEKEDFSGPDLGEQVDIEDDTTFTIYDLDPGSTYYWKVAVTAPVASRYSEVFSFQTKVAQVTAPVEVRPLPGAQDVILEPTFAWRAADGVDYYEVDVATDANFTSIVTSGTPEANTWAIDVALDYATVYYWRVRGIAPTGIPEADYVVSIFTTMEKPAAAAPPVKVEEVQPPEITVEVPAPVSVIPSWMALTIIIIGAVLVIALIVLIVRTRRVV